MHTITSSDELLELKQVSQSMRLDAWCSGWRRLVHRICLPCLRPGVAPHKLRTLNNTHAPTLLPQGEWEGRLRSECYTVRKA